MGRDRGNQNNLHVWASKTHGGGRGHRAPTSPRTRGLLPGHLLEPRSSGLPQAGHQPALSLWKRPRSRDKETRRSGQALRAPRLPASPSHHPTSGPKQPLTRMQAATTPAAVAPRLCPALTSTRVDPHQLSFQSKPQSRSREPPPPQLRPVPAEVTRTLSASTLPPTGASPLPSGSASGSVTACPVPGHAQ